MSASAVGPGTSIPSAPTPKCRSQERRASAGRSSPSTSPGSNIRKSLPAACIFVNRMVEGILTASPGNNQPEDDRKTVGKRFTFAYLLGVRKEHVYRRRRIGALFV